jgi:hypothetical protein
VPYHFSCDNWEVIVEFNSNDLHILRFLSFYRVFSIFSMVFGLLGVPIGLYFRFRSELCAYSDNALITASIVVLAMGYMLHCFVRLIGVFKRDWLREGQRGNP